MNSKKHPSTMNCRAEYDYSSGILQVKCPANISCRDCLCEYLELGGLISPYTGKQWTEDAAKILFNSL